MVAPIIGRGPDLAGRAMTQRSDTKPVTQTATEVRPAKSAVIRTPADAINVLRARLEQRTQEAMGHVDGGSATAATDQFMAQQPPSATDVANRLLGFVQNRLQTEADAGADIERLADLLAQARAGIDKGYGEAREQITALGLMTETLAGEIDDGFDRIQSGLLDLEKLFLDKEPHNKQTTD